MTIVEEWKELMVRFVISQEPTMRLGTKGIDVHPVLANRYESYSSYQAVAPEILCLTPL